MITASLILGATLLGQPPVTVKGHTDNALYGEIVTKGLTIGGKTVTFPAPMIPDTGSADEAQILFSLNGKSSSLVKDFTRASVDSRFKIETPTLNTPGGKVQRVDLWFVVHSTLEALDPVKNMTGTGADAKQEVEMDQYKFSARQMNKDELLAKKITLHDTPRWKEVYVFENAILDGKVDLQTTDHIVATRDDNSWVVAFQTAPEFANDPVRPNRWKHIAQRNEKARAIKDEPYSGGGGYAKISRLSTVPGALLVESHIAYSEPTGWFNGRPILRSKMFNIAEDRIRQMRRDLKTKQAARR